MKRKININKQLSILTAFLSVVIIISFITPLTHNHTTAYNYLTIIMSFTLFIISTILIQLSDSQTLIFFKPSTPVLSKKNLEIKKVDK